MPNLPFFYLVYRAWSHWRALGGSKHVQFLLQHKLLNMTPSRILDQVYADQKQPLPSSPSATTDSDPDATTTADPAGVPNADGETMLLSQANGKKMSQALDLPQLEVELERAIWQVEAAIKKQNAKEAKADSSASHSKTGTEDAAGGEEKKLP